MAAIVEIASEFFRQIDPPDPFQVASGGVETAPETIFAGKFP